MSMQDALHRLVGQKNDGMGLEIGSEIPGSNKKDVNQLFQFGIPSLHIPRDPANVIDQPLDLVPLLDRHRIHH